MAGVPTFQALSIRSQAPQKYRPQGTDRQPAGGQAWQADVPRRRNTEECAFLTIKYLFFYSLWQKYRAGEIIYR